MKKLLLGTVALVALGATVPALAADLGARPYTKAPALCRHRSTTGPASISAVTPAAPSAADNSFNGLALSNYDGRFLGGVQVGADYQFAPNWVVGIEGQYSWLSNNKIGAIFPAGFVYSNNQRGLGSITGRLGYSWGPALFYAKGGYAYSEPCETLTFGGAPMAFTLNRSHRDGYTVGAGLEYLFTRTGRPRPSISITISATANFVDAGPAGPVRHLQQRRAHPESRRELSLQPGRFGAARY